MEKKTNIRLLNEQVLYQVLAFHDDYVQFPS